MTNGSNAHGVTFAQISWLNRMLTGHANVTGVTRTNDIQFDVERGRGQPIRIICLDEYTCSIAKVFEVCDEFPGVNLIYVGGMWNSYTGDAKQHCVEAQIGLFNTKEMSGALHRNDFWNYVRRD